MTATTASSQQQRRGVSNKAKAAAAALAAFGKLLFFLVALPAAVTALQLWLEAVTSAAGLQQKLVRVAVSPSAASAHSSVSFSSAAASASPPTIGEEGREADLSLGVQQQQKQKQQRRLEFGGAYHRESSFARPPTASYQRDPAAAVATTATAYEPPSPGRYHLNVLLPRAVSALTDSSVNPAGDGEATRHGFRRNPNRNNQQQQGGRPGLRLALLRLLRPLAERPATLLLLALNVALALLYWLYRVDPRDVGKVYSRMVPTGGGGEAWRCLTGATAHFEIWHLVFNMMALESLGRELEGRRMYPPIEFFLYNVSLVPLTAAAWLASQYLVKKYNRGRSNQAADDDVPTVGFSGVLFAWMVVAALEQRETCPVFFAPDLCFTTYDVLGGVRVSLAPLVQLAVAQVILPRVSLLGHLAGMMCGFLLHWGFLPIEYFQPAVSVPVLCYVYLRMRKCISPLLSPSPAQSVPQVGQALQAADDDDESGGGGGGERQLKFQLRLMMSLHVMLLFLSAFVLGTLNGSTISFGLIGLFWYHIARGIIGSALTISGSGNHRTSVPLVRFYVSCASIVAVTNGMTLGSWLFASSPNAAATFALIFQCAILLFGICLSWSLTGLLPEQESGVFKYALGFTVVGSAKTVGDWLFSPLAAATSGSSGEGVNAAVAGSVSGPWSPFAGSGQRLGGGSRRTTAREQQEQETPCETSGQRQELSELL